MNYKRIEELTDKTTADRIRTASNMLSERHAGQLYDNDSMNDMLTGAVILGIENLEDQWPGKVNLYVRLPAVNDEVTVLTFDPYMRDADDLTLEDLSGMCINIESRGLDKRIFV